MNRFFQTCAVTWRTRKTAVALSVMTVFFAAGFSGIYSIGDESLEVQKNDVLYQGRTNVPRSSLQEAKHNCGNSSANPFAEGSGCSAKDLNADSQRYEDSSEPHTDIVAQSSRFVARTMRDVREGKVDAMYQFVEHSSNCKIFKNSVGDGVCDLQALVSHDAEFLKYAEAASVNGNISASLVLAKWHLSVLNAMYNDASMGNLKNYVDRSDGGAQAYAGSAQVVNDSFTQNMQTLYADPRFKESLYKTKSFLARADGNELDAQTIVKELTKFTH
jgi:hypothetical protein